MTGFIKRTVGFNSSTDVRKALYTTLVRSILEYCSPLWSPQSRKLMSLVEGVQRRATKFILGAHSNTLTYKERLSTLGLLPLAHRREVCDVMVFIKSKPIVHKPSRYLRSHMLTPIRVRTSAFSSSYIPRLVTIWNQLSPVLRNIGVQASEMSNILTFKRSLVRATFMRFDTQFNIDVPCSWSTSFIVTIHGSAHQPAGPNPPYQPQAYQPGTCQDRPLTPPGTLQLPGRNARASRNPIASRTGLTED
ncbi:hypothetical protein Bbelb_299300 [Branchiostoma belcheri]|nr:hypothetical protein Bbelb_299300 [Branchiostoma belcheri]